MDSAVEPSLAAPAAAAPRVTMLLRGGLTHDARVVRQAQTLGAAGYAVSVISVDGTARGAVPSRHPAGFDVWTLPSAPPLVLTPRRLWATLRRAGRRAAAGGQRAEGAGKVAAPPAPKRRFDRLGPLRMGRMFFHRSLTYLRMLALLRRLRPDVIVAHNVNTLAAGWLGARLYGARLVYDAHEISTHRGGYYRQLVWLVKRLEGFAMPRADAVFTTTDMRADHFVAYYGLARRPLVLQNRPVLVEPERSDALRRAVGSDDARPIVLYQGGLQPGRGLSNLVRIAARIDDAQFVFLGSGAQEAELKAMVAELGLDARVRFHAAVPMAELPGLTAGADIGMQIIRNTCLNHWTTDSNKIFEYGMAGLAVVASDFPEIRRIVDGHGFGLLVDPEDLDAMIAAVRRLLDEPELRERCQAAARAARHELSWQAIAADYRAVFDALTGR